MSGIFLIIPPLTQLNTPYPATAYLNGFLKSHEIPTRQADLGLDMVLSLFNRGGLEKLFNAIESGSFRLNPALTQMLANRRSYEDTIDAVIAFLQDNNYTFAYRVARRNVLPESTRFDNLNDLAWFFGSIGVQDKARYLCTMYLEDLSDLIVATVGPQFGFSKYAERVARTAVSFDPIEEALEAPTNFLDDLLLQCAASYFSENTPDLVGMTVPFGGNLYGALKIGQWIKHHHPQVKIVIGGGYANTELRELSDPRVFNYVDYITLDDGEGPIMALYEHLQNPSAPRELKRTYLRENGAVVFINNKIGGEYKHAQLPAPDYEGLRMDRYLSMFDMPNPMHRMWNDGRWNKLTIAHGCYWKKCSFCDISLDYIQRYDPAPAKHLVDKMEALIAQTGNTGFHFVDEAAPPLAMRDLAIEILRRGLQVTWWTNIRFEKTFSEDLCKLLAASGCVAVTGGLEVASPRLLEMMEKGITLDQVARVCKGFRDAGIFVHAYLMYGFPTQTEQETIDSLEVVRQLFANDLLQSAFWHQFAMTVHSPVGLNPEKYQVIRTGPEFRGFANNDLYHEDPTGADHEKYSEGLKKALYNYMHGHLLDKPLQTFFTFKIPRTTQPNDMMERFVRKPGNDVPDVPGYRLMWHRVHVSLKKAAGKSREITFTRAQGSVKMEMPEAVARYVLEHAHQFEVTGDQTPLFNDIVATFAALSGNTADQLMRQEWWRKWRREVVWLIKSPN